jgi:hypothetical protein
MQSLSNKDYIVDEKNGEGYDSHSEHSGAIKKVEKKLSTERKVHYSIYRVYQVYKNKENKYRKKVSTAVLLRCTHGL